MATRLRYTPQKTPAMHPNNTLWLAGIQTKLMSETNGQIMSPLEYILTESYRNLRKPVLSWGPGNLTWTMLFATCSSEAPFNKPDTTIEKDTLAAAPTV